MKKNAKKLLKSQKVTLGEKLLRFSGDDSKALDYDNPQLLKSVDRVINVSSSGIKAKLKQADKNASIDSLLIANENDFKCFHDVICNKSGKVISKRSMNEFDRLLKIHSKEDSLKLLVMTACHNYSIEWIDTSPEVLNKLMVNDMAGYFVYCASQIFDVLPVQNKLNRILINEEITINYSRLMDKKIAYSRLQTMQQTNPELLLEANELLRKLLGMAAMDKQSVKTFYSAISLTTAVYNLNALELFIADLKSHLVFIMRKHFQTVQVKIKNKQHKLYKITNEDINAVKKALKGKSNLHQQPKIKNHSKKESILLDLKDFCMNEFDSNDGLEFLDDFEILDHKEPPKNAFKLDGKFEGIKVNDSSKSARSLQTKKPTSESRKTTDKPITFDGLTLQGKTVIPEKVIESEPSVKELISILCGFEVDEMEKIDINDKPVKKEGFKLNLNIKVKG